MPKSKRQRVKPLTKTISKGGQLKQKLVEMVRGAVDEFESFYVFSFENMRTNHFKNVRMDFRDSRFFLGKNKVMTVAFGRMKEEEYADNLSQVGQYLSGNVGLLFTNQKTKEVEEYFNSICVPDFPRSGFTATETICVKEGELNQFEGSRMEGLRKLGLPVRLNKGMIELTQDHTICTKGDVLSPEQAKLLEYFGHTMAEFKLSLVCRWSNGEFETYN